MKYIYDLFINSIYNNKDKFSLYVAIIMILLLSISIVSILTIFIIVIIVIIISYYIVKYLEINIVNDIYFCNYNYNKKSIELLKKYGDYKIKKNIFG
jgi:hypothetical protein